MPVRIRTVSTPLAIAGSPRRLTSHSQTKSGPNLMTDNAATIALTASTGRRPVVGCPAHQASRTAGPMSALTLPDHAVTARP